MSRAGARLQSVDPSAYNPLLLHPLRASAVNLNISTSYISTADRHRQTEKPWTTIGGRLSRTNTQLLPRTNVASHAPRTNGYLAARSGQSRSANAPWTPLGHNEHPHTPPTLSPASVVAKVTAHLGHSRPSGSQSEASEGKAWDTSEKSGKEKVQHASPTARSLASAAASHATSSRVGHGRLAARLQSMAKLLLPSPKKLLAPCSGTCV